VLKIINKKLNHAYAIAKKSSSPLKEMQKTGPGLNNTHDKLINKLYVTAANNNTTVILTAG
jgi:hypothetical protein